MKTFPLRLEDDLHKRLRHAAIEDDLSLHDWILCALEERLKRQDGPRDDSIPEGRPQ